MPKVVRVIARLNVGGPARHCLLLGRALEERGFEHVLATGDLDEGEASGVDPLLAEGQKIVRIPGLGRRISPRDDLRALLALVALFKKEKPDIVHTHTAKAGALGRIAARIAGVPHVVHTFHGHVLSGYFGRIGSALACLAERVLALVTDRIVVLSPAQRDDLAHRFKVARPSRMRIVPLGRDLDAISRAPRGQLRRELGLPEEVPLLLYVGRLVPIKDPLALLDAFRAATSSGGRAGKAVLAIAGKGPLEEAVRERARSLGISERVRLLGWRDDLGALLADADALVLSSKNEGTPLAIIEAFAAGTPIIATAVGGIPDMLSPPTSVEDSCEVRAEGLLVPSGESRALCRALLRALDDSTFRERRSGACREAARRYDVSRLVDDVISLYEELLPRKLVEVGACS